MKISEGPIRPRSAAAPIIIEGTSAANMSKKKAQRALDWLPSDQLDKLTLVNHVDNLGNLVISLSDGCMQKKYND